MKPASILRFPLKLVKETLSTLRYFHFKRNDIYILEGWVVEALLSELNTLISEQNEKDFNYLTYYGMP